ncbi:hypothetical protein GGX14DRAFT_397736 [Mycena pura]|uniref:Uncharacterized protein n=1 Tax=Mycena pura TaxID=153505 RepID=A0AAD6YE85_9AGAR|nr:hypothetical protein GGX14DRAFT_397736 [Mycena pura]
MPADQARGAFQHPDFKRLPLRHCNSRPLPLQTTRQGWYSVRQNNLRRWMFRLLGPVSRRVTQPFANVIRQPHHLQFEESLSNRSLLLYLSLWDETLSSMGPGQLGPPTFEFDSAYMEILSQRADLCFIMKARTVTESWGWILDTLQLTYEVFKPVLGLVPSVVGRCFPPGDSPSDFIQDPRRAGHLYSTPQEIAEEIVLLWIRTFKQAITASDEMDISSAECLLSVADCGSSATLLHEIETLDFSVFQQFPDPPLAAIRFWEKQVANSRRCAKLNGWVLLEPYITFNSYVHFSHTQKSTKIFPSNAEQCRVAFFCILTMPLRSVLPLGAKTPMEHHESPVNAAAAAAAAANDDDDDDLALLPQEKRIQLALLLRAGSSPCKITPRDPLLLSKRKFLKNHKHGRVMSSFERRRDMWYPWNSSDAFAVVRKAEQTQNYEERRFLDSPRQNIRRAIKISPNGAPLDTGLKIEHPYS